jgi:hypothetical protein
MSIGEVRNGLIGPARAASPPTPSELSPLMLTGVNEIERKPEEASMQACLATFVFI